MPAVESIETAPILVAPIAKEAPSIVAAPVTLMSRIPASICTSEAAAALPSK